MKKLLTFIAIFFSTFAISQKVDTVSNALQIKPMVVNAIKGDTAYQLKWSINMVRGTENTGYIVMFDRLGNKVHDFNVTLPNQRAMWVSDRIVDSLIMVRYKLLPR